MKQRAVTRAKLIGGILSALVFGLVISITLFGNTDFENAGTIGDYTDIITIVLVAFLSVWCVYVDYRIQSAKVHTYALTIYFASLAWLILDYFRRLVYFSPTAIRIFTYLYAAPVLLLAVLCFLLFFEIFFEESKYKRVIRAGVVVAALVLFCLVMTNDVHQFYIIYPSGVNSPDKYAFGFLFYVVRGYSILLFALSIVLFCLGTAKRNNHSQIVSSVIVGMALIVYNLTYVFAYKEVAKVPVLSNAALVTAVFGMSWFEVCMQCGLIQNSGRYLKYMADSMVALCVKDDGGNTVYKTTSFNEKDYIEKVNRDIKYTEKVISGGKVIVCEDLTKINKLRRQSAKQNARLKRSNELLAKNRGIKEEEAALNARRALYEEIENAVELKVKEIEKLSKNLPDEITSENKEVVKNELAAIRLRLGYLKQKSMLMLLAKTENVLPEKEFKMLTDIIKSDIRSVGLFSVAFNVACGKTVAVEFALAFNDFVEYIAESFSFSNAAVFISINTEKDIVVANLESEKEIELPEHKKPFSDFGYDIDCQKEGLEYRIVMKRGAE